MSKISALGAITSVNSDDVLPVVDVHDTSMASTGTTKKITLAQVVAVQAAAYAPTGLAGASAASRYAGATVSGAPASGTFAVGDFVVDQSGTVWVCTVAGTPGTWVKSGVALDTTAADIQPFGVQAAGATGKAADAAHVHPWQPWQFLPESYGAKGNGKVVGDVSTTSGSKVITSASAAFTAGDVGKYVMIHGGNGTGSGPIIDVIASVQSGTQATLTTNNAGATASNCPMVYGTDDTAAIQSAVAAAGTYGTANQYFAEVLFGSKIYILGSGPTRVGDGSTTPTFNSQITLPYPNANGTTQKLVIALTGAGDAGYCQFWGSTTPGIAGSALVSMVTRAATVDGTYGVQSVVGGPTSGSGSVGASPPGFSVDGGGGSAFANVKVAVKGMSIWQSILTNIRAWNFEWLSQARAQQSSAHIFAPSGVNGGAQPYLKDQTSNGNFGNTLGVGFEFPQNTNNAVSVADNLVTEGYSIGFRLYDHFTAGRLSAIYTDTAVWAARGGGLEHLISIQSMDAEVYLYGLRTDGGGVQTCQVDINWSAECGSVTADVYDAGNYLRGVFHFADPADASRGITVNGASNLKVINDQFGPGQWTSGMTPAVPAVPATTVAKVNTAWRDATVYITSGGAAVTVIKVDAVTTGLTLGTSGTVAVRVPSGHSITLTYASTAPTWVWVLE